MPEAHTKSRQSRRLKAYLRPQKSAESQSRAVVPREAQRHQPSKANRLMILRLRETVVCIRDVVPDDVL